MNTDNKSSNKWRRYVVAATVAFWLYWAVMYASQKMTEHDIDSYTGPVISVKGIVVEKVFGGKNDFPFGKDEWEVHLDNGKIYVLYTDEILPIDIDDVIVIYLPQQYKESRNGKIHAKKYEMIKKAPLKITYH